MARPPRLKRVDLPCGCTLVLTVRGEAIRAVSHVGCRTHGERGYASCSLDPRAHIGRCVPKNAWIKPQ